MLTMQTQKIKYPDGQISVKIEDDAYPIIKERINSYEDLFFIKSIAEASQRKLDLFIPCLFGQRSDRRFSPTQSFDLKIIADFINGCGFKEVTILDPHSDVALALINNSVKESSFKFIEIIVNTNPSLVLVSPDAGAYKKVFEYGAALNRPVVAAVKHRDLDGKIDLSFMGDVNGKDCLIVDVLADGGYTFWLLGKKLKEQGATKVLLYVTHGYFSKGFDQLKEYIDHVYCTNSVKDIEDPFVTQFNVI